MINQPVNQVRLTNVAIVKYKYKGKRFEIACYKNKVHNYRNHLESDLDEVLQINEVFTNVSKGTVAKKKELDTLFGKSTKKEQIIKMILEKGELQVSNLEREDEQSTKFNEIASTIRDKCVHPETRRQYPITFIKKALDDIHFAVKPNKPTKKQALDVIKELESRIAITRAQMRLKVEVNLQDADRAKECIKDFKDLTIEKSQETEQKYSIVFLVHPSHFRDVNENLPKVCEEPTIEVISHLVINEGVQEIKDDQVQNLSKEAQNMNINDDAEEEKKESSKGKGKGKKEKEFRCSSCTMAVFDDVKLYREHFKTPWHLFNLKRKMKNLEIVSEQDFEENQDELIETIM